MKPKLITVQAEFAEGKRPMQAMQISPNLCLLRRYDYKENDFDRWKGPYDLIHAKIGKTMFQSLMGRKDKLINLAEQIENTVDLSFDVEPFFTYTQQVAVYSILSDY